MGLFEKLKKNFFEREFVPEMYDAFSPSNYHYRRLTELAGVGEEDIILDVGCGTCPYLDLEDRRYKLVGLDASEKMLRKAEEKGGDLIDIKGQLSGKDILRLLGKTDNDVILNKGDARTLPFEDSTFDAVISYNLLQHTDTASVIKEKARVLKSGKKLIVVTNSSTSKEAESLLKKLGFHNVENVRPKMPKLYEVFEQSFKASRYGMREMLKMKGKLESKPLEGIIKETLEKMRRLDLEKLPLPYLLGTKPENPPKF